MADHHDILDSALDRLRSRQWAGPSTNPSLEKLFMHSSKSDRPHNLKLVLGVGAALIGCGAVAAAVRPSLWSAAPSHETRIAVAPEPATSGIEAAPAAPQPARNNEARKAEARKTPPREIRHAEAARAIQALPAPATAAPAPAPVTGEWIRAESTALLLEEQARSPFFWDNIGQDELALFEQFMQGDDAAGEAFLALTDLAMNGCGEAGHPLLLEATVGEFAGQVRFLISTLDSTRPTADILGEHVIMDGADGAFELRLEAQAPDGTSFSFEAAAPRGELKSIQLPGGAGLLLKVVPTLTPPAQP